MTGSLPVHDEPPIIAFTVGLFCSSAEGSLALVSAEGRSAAALACFVPGLGPPPRASFFFFGPIRVKKDNFTLRVKGEEPQDVEIHGRLKLAKALTCTCLALFFFFFEMTSAMITLSNHNQLDPHTQAHFTLRSFITRHITRQNPLIPPSSSLADSILR